MSFCEKGTYIQNVEQLTSHGNSKLRHIAVEILEYALASADPYQAIGRLVDFEEPLLKISDQVFDLDEYERLFILGAGKASRGIAQALEDMLGDRITGGLFVLKHGDEVDLTQAEVIYAAHPIPDEYSYQGAERILSMAETFTEKDLVIAGITGGSSALLALPPEGISLEDIQKVNQILLLSGADIVQINSVRKHLSRIKGGLLAKEIFPATLINLTVSDVVGDMFDYITGPTVPDTSTFEQARRVMERYELWEVFPPSANDYLRDGKDELETPKSFKGFPLHSFLIVPGDAACVGAEKRAQELGFNTMVLTSMLKGEAKEAGSFFSSIGQEILSFDRPLGKPCVIIAGGENVVTINSGDKGEGGPNQEFALAASLEIAGQDQMLIAAIDTDGSDGSTSTAGGMVDGSTIRTAEFFGFDPVRNLKLHNSNELLCKTGDAIFTGPTGTNVNDLKLLIISQ